MEIKHTIKPISQIRDVKDRTWKRRSCGIASLCMVKNHYNTAINKRSLQELIDTGVKIGAYRPGVGWTHQGLIDLAKQYGFQGERFDHSQTDPEEGFNTLLTHVDQGPVIASIHKDFDRKNGGHLIVVNGYIKNDSGTIISIVDPQSKKRKRNIRTISQARFMNGWKKRFIVIRPDNVV